MLYIKKFFVPVKVPPLDCTCIGTSTQRQAGGIFSHPQRVCVTTAKSKIIAKYQINYDTHAMDAGKDVDQKN